MPVTRTRHPCPSPVPVTLPVTVPQVFKKLELSTDMMDGISEDKFVLLYLEEQENAAATHVQALLRGHHVKAHRPTPTTTPANSQPSSPRLPPTE